MKIFTQFVAACLLSQAIFAQPTSNQNSTTDSWTRKADFPILIQSAAGFIIHDKIYMGIGGAKGSSIISREFWEYDPTTDKWSRKADFAGEARGEAIGFSINGKGYIGIGSSGDYPYTYYKDFWEYDPVTDKWTRKADFGGNARMQATGFAIGDKGYIGTGYTFTEGYYSDFWEYDPLTDKWTRKDDFGGGGRSNPASFTIGNKAYVGTGFFNGNTTDFWEYDPATGMWTRKADFAGSPREWAASFSVDDKGYFCTGLPFTKENWQYDPKTDKWARKADFGGVARSYALGFAIGNKGYLGTGEDGSIALKDFWEYTPDDITVSCPTPFGITIDSVTSTATRVGWDLPSSTVSGFQLRYRPAGTPLMRERLINPTSTHVILRNLEPNTTYKWRIRSVCSNGFSDWVHGPDFTTTSAIAFSSGEDAKGSSLIVNNHVQIIPNPSKGNFTIQMQLPAKDALTTLALYNSLGERVWQQQGGMLSGAVTKSIALDNKLSSGVYVLRVERNDVRLMQKVVVTK